MTILLPDALSGVQVSLMGVQRPRIHVVPEYVSSAGHDALECAALAGIDLDPWQQLVLLDGLGERPDGKWAAFEVAEEVPRQNGKGGVLEVRELTGMFAFEQERLLIHSAHEQITSSEHFIRLLNLIEGVPEFDRRVKKVVKGKGAEAIELRDGTRILFKTRTAGGGRGLTGDFVALDEAMILALGVIGVLIPTMAARSIIGNPQVWYAGSSVDREKHEHGVAFARVRSRALRGDPSLAYFGFGADVKGWLESRGLKFDEERSELEQVTAGMLDDPEMWAQANPGMGIRISLEHIALERGALGPREFAVERLGITDPPDVTDTAARPIDLDKWAACAENDRAQRITSQWALSVETNDDQTWGSVGIAGSRDDGLPQIALAAHQRGVEWIVDRVVELTTVYPDASVVVDKRGPAANLIDDLVKAAVTVVSPTTQEYADACADFVKDVNAVKLRFPAPQPELDDAIAAAEKQRMGERWKWSRKTPAVPLVAATLARWGIGRGLKVPKDTWRMF